MANAGPVRPSGTPSSSTPSPTSRKVLHRSGVSWTDDLPVCTLSDIGTVANAVYLQDGRTMEAHQYSECSFNFRSDNGCYLYGLFDGHDGVKAALFAKSRLPAELLLGQINPNYNPADSSIRKVLYQSFSIVERGFFESIDDALAKRTYLQAQIPDRMSTETAAKRYREIFQRIQNLDNEIKGGTTAVVALIINNKLFVANVGECRALLCRFDQKANYTEVQQLSVDHNIYQAQEIARLRKLGLNIENLQYRGKLGVNQCTRCIGDYSVKGGYKESEHLKDSTSEPSIAEPSITEGICIDDYPGSFLLLMSDDLYKSVQQCVRNIDANEYLAQLTSRELRAHKTIEGVAQAVVDKVAYMHQRAYGNRPMTCRGDMTLVVRNISHPIGTCAPAYIGISEYRVSVPFDEVSANGQSKSNIRLQIQMPNSAIYSSQNRGMGGSYSSGTPSDDTPTNLEGGTSGIESSSDLLTSHPSQSHSLLAEDQDEEFIEENFFKCDPNETLQLDNDGRVEPYIKFDTFYEHNGNSSNNTKRNAWTRR